MTPRLERASKIIQWAIDNKKSLREACEYFKVNERYLRKTRQQCKNQEGYKEFINLYNSFKGQQTEQQSDLKPGQKKFTESDNNASFEYSGDKMITSLEEAISFFKIDTRIWEVERWICNSYPVSGKEREQNLTWNQGVMDGYAIRSGNWTSKVNYQVKVWLKKKIEFEAAIKFEDFFTELLRKHKPVTYPKIKYAKNKSKHYSLEISLPDVHVGKMGWGKETRDGDYDTKIAIERYNKAVDFLIGQTEHIKTEIEEIILPVGNDLLNIDNLRNETTNGTPQSVDSRWQQMFLKTKSLIIENVDKLRLIARVKILMVSGNHDYQTVFYLGEALKAWYRNDKSVEIDNSPSYRKYYVYGSNLIAFTHGNEEAHRDLGLIVADEEPQLWAETKFRQIHLGHFHKKKEIRWVDGDEYRGFRIKILPSLSGSDSWHASKGYSSLKAGLAFLYDRDNGQVAEYSFNIA